MLSSWSKTSFAFVTSWLPLLLLLSVESSDGGNFSIVAESKMAPLRILLVVGCLLVVVVVVIGVEAAGGPASSSSSDIVMPGIAGVVIVPEARMSSAAAIVAVIYAREPPLAFETMATPPVKMTLPHKVLKG